MGRRGVTEQLLGVYITVERFWKPSLINAVLPVILVFLLGLMIFFLSEPAGSSRDGSRSDAASCPAPAVLRSAAASCPRAAPLRRPPLHTRMCVHNHASSARRCPARRCPQASAPSTRGWR